MGPRYEVWKGQITATLKPVGDGFFKITSTGFSQDGRVKRSIVCTAVVRKTSFNIVSWRAIN